MKRHILYLILALIISSCRGPVKHLQLSDWHKQQAIKQGAKVKIDTVTFHFKSPEIKFSTTIRPTWEKHSLSKDTLKYTDPKTGASVTTKIGLKEGCPEDCIQHIYHEVDCPPQEMTVDVPCETVQAGYTVWDAVIFGLFMIPGGWLIMTFLIVPLVRFIRK